MDELRSAKLTKKYLMGLPPGIFLMSNLIGPDLAPRFAEYVISPISEREKQWRKIVSLGCNGKLCRIFKMKELASAFVSNCMAD